MDRLARGYIQIHHLKPVSFMRGEPMSMSDALANVRPLCANCHQMAHRKTPPLKIADIRSIRQGVVQLFSKKIQQFQELGRDELYRPSF